MAAGAVATPTAGASRLAPVSGACLTTAARSGPSTYSVTRYAVPPSNPASSTGAVQNLATRRAASASLPNLLLNSSRAAGSGRIVFTATAAPPYRGDSIWYG
ncbi:hypothetical protein [Nonomuraea sp. NPDC049625]|uniref:hypothetical protein n=1 Tax=Nonomuraea sp. NPDC049625 TaxID=3155775 RepID=UPI003447DC0E